LPHGHRRRRCGDGLRSDGRRDCRDDERRLGGLVRQLLDSPQGELRSSEEGPEISRVSGPFRQKENSMNESQDDMAPDDESLTLKGLHAHRHWWTNLKVALSASSPKGVSALRKAWRRSWIGGVVWPWCQREAEIVAKVAGVVTLSLWLKRLIEQ